MADSSLFGFPSKNRLHSHWEYRLFYGKSRFLKLSQCLIYQIPNILGHYRLGITLKTRGLSLHRNQVKRSIREFFRTHPSYLGSFDYTVVVPAGRKIQPPFAAHLTRCLHEEFMHQALPPTYSQMVS